MDLSKILTVVVGSFLACDYIQAYPMTTAAEVTEPTHPHHGYGVVLDYYAHPKYQFDYSVYDPDTGDVKKQWESRDGDVVHGSYTIHDPDGTIRTVDYTADKHTGFNAVVKRLGKSYHPKTVIARKFVAGHSYSGGNYEQAANVEHHAEVRHEGATSGQAEQGSHVALASHQSPQEQTATYQPAAYQSATYQPAPYQPAQYQPAPFQTASHMVEPQHIVSHQSVTHHIMPQALPLQAEEHQSEPHNGAPNRPEEEAKAEPVAEAEQTNEVAPQIEAVESPKEESEGNAEISQPMMAEEVQQDDGSVYYVPVNFESRRYRSAEKSKSN